jgi:O-antigen/teichoic acid export membrane protein
MSDSDPFSGARPKLAQRALKRVIAIGRYSNDLHQRAARGSVLVLSSRLAIKSIQFIRTVVIARLLFPHDVGLFALATSALGIADIIVQPGMASAVIQKETLDRRHLDTAWTSGVLRSLFFWSIAFLAAPIAGHFFLLDSIVPIIRILAIAVAINGFENIGAILLQRDLQFNRKIIYDVSIILSETAVTVIAAFILHSVWALVLGQLANKCATVTLSYIIHPYRPRFLFDREAFRELFIYGKWVGATGVVLYFVAQGDTLVAGKMLGSAAVGYYALAFGLALLPAVEIAKSLGALIFPHLSRLPQQERGGAFLLIFRNVLLVSIPASVGLAIVASPLVWMVYGGKWLPMLSAFYILIMYGGVRTISYLIEPLYLSMGRPRVVTTSTSIHFLVMMSSIVPLADRYGIAGIAIAVLLGSIAACSYLAYGIRREKIVRLRQMIFAGFLPVAASCAMAAVLIAAQEILAINTKLLLVTYIIGGVLVYGAVLFILDRISNRSVWRSIVWLKTSL